MHRPFFPCEEEALATPDQSVVARGLGLPGPSVGLIETAGVARRSQRIFGVRPLSLSDLQITAGGTTKGCVGVQPQRKERLNNLVIETVTDHCQSDHYRQVPVPLLWLSEQGEERACQDDLVRYGPILSQEKSPKPLSRGTYAPKTSGEPLTDQSLSGTCHPGMIRISG